MKDAALRSGPRSTAYFDQDTQYAVTTVQKYFGLPRTGVINTAVDFALTHFQYTPAEPKSEPDRVEIDLDKQVLTLYQNWQPQLLTTTSTGSGEHFCGGVDGCQYAITPDRPLPLLRAHHGLAEGQARHDVEPVLLQRRASRCTASQSVPTYPASHGCARIPMHIADYFYTLVHQGRVGVRRRHAEEGRQRVRRARRPRPATTASTTTTTHRSKTTDDREEADDDHARTADDEAEDHDHRRRSSQA